MRNISNIKHRNPNDQSIRDAYYQSSKNFQDICKQQKIIFWNKKIQDLEENCMNNPNTNSYLEGLSRGCGQPRSSTKGW